MCVSVLTDERGGEMCQRQRKEGWERLKNVSEKEVRLRRRREEDGNRGGVYGETPGRNEGLVPVRLRSRAH